MEHDGTYKNKRGLDVDWLVETAKRHAVECDETGFIAFGPTGTAVQVKASTLHQVSPPDSWTWESRKCEHYPREAFVVRDGVRFYALFDDDEAEAVR